MYEAFFGLRERPFSLTPDPTFLFLGPRHQEALSTLQYALEGPRGLMLLIGEAGTGKTTLVQAALRAGGNSDLEYVVLSNPTLTRPEFYEFLAGAFHLPEEAARSKTRFLGELRRHVEERHSRGKRTAILIDEAQSLPYELLEEIRLLGNMESATTKYLTLVLTGQPELADRLNENRLRQLKQRIALRCELGALDLPETAAYLSGRLRIAGGSPVAIFTRDAVEAIHEGSQGVPRVINVVADNALISGFATETKPVSRARVEEVLHDFDFASAKSMDTKGGIDIHSIPVSSAASTGSSPPIDRAQSSADQGVEDEQRPSRFATFRRRLTFF